MTDSATVLALLREHPRTSQQLAADLEWPVARLAPCLDALWRRGSLTVLLLDDAGRPVRLLAPS